MNDQLNNISSSSEEQQKKISPEFTYSMKSSDAATSQNKTDFNQISNRVQEVITEQSKLYRTPRYYFHSFTHSFLLTYT